MATTRKIEELAAIRMEIGKLAASAWAWNGATIISLGADNAFPYEEKNPKVNILTGTDNSIENAGFTDLPVQLGIEAPLDSFGGICKYDNMDKILYWMLGYEDGGTSPVALGGGYYEHLFELDPHERHFTAYRTAEQTAGDYDPTDRKNRAMTIAFKRGPNDHRYHHVMCTGFTFSSSSDDGFVRWSSKGISPSEGRDDYDSSTWTLPTTLQGSALDVLHRHCTVSLKPQAGSFVDLAVSDWEISVDIPLNMSRDTVSGLYLAEPVFEGKYTINASITLSRHSADTYLAYRDDWSGAKLAMKIVASTGSYSMEFYLPEMRISDTAPTGDDVPKQPITFQTGPVNADTANIFATEIADSVLIQNGNFFVITNNTNSVNEMRRE